MPSLTSSGHRPKSQRLEARITGEEQELFRRAASLSGRSVSAFVTHSALDAARRLIRESTVTELSADETKAFVQALLNPPRPNAKLRAAFKRYREAGLR